MSAALLAVSVLLVCGVNGTAVWQGAAVTLLLALVSALIALRTELRGTGRISWRRACGCDAARRVDSGAG
jgi:hypothetical protein